MKVFLVSIPSESLVLTGRMGGAVVPLSGVDWAQEVVLVLDMGEQRTAGYGIRIRSASVTSSVQVDLQVEIDSPGAGAFVAQVMTHPFAVQRLSRVQLLPGDITVVVFDQAGSELVRQVVRL